MRSSHLSQRFFLLLLAAVSAAFAWVIFPLSGAIIWAVVLAIVFQPVNDLVARRLHANTTLASLATTGLVVVAVLVPAILTAGFIVQEARQVQAQMRSGEIDVTSMYERMTSALPSWLTEVLNGAGLNDLPALIDRLKTAIAEGGQPIATQVWSFGQGALDFSISFSVMLYLLFFLLRDGGALIATVQRALPLEAEVQRRLFERFAAVVRSTIKGNIVVAALQGTLGGVALMVLGIPAALLWGVVMAFLSLVPAVGAALVWGPIAVYLLINGQIWQGVTLIAFGAVVIGLVDNLLRPVLVGKQSKMPDYLVLITTIGGIAVFGISGFVVGPLIAALFLASWEIFAESRRGSDHRP
jgi:predicted PurR-regulated permease PerM